MPNLEFKKENNLLVLIYTPHSNETSWVYNKFDEGKNLNIPKEKIFTFTKNDLYLDDSGQSFEIDDEESIQFIFAELVGDYFKVKKEILSIKHFLFIHKSIEISVDYFIAKTNISIFRKIDKLISEDIYIGGEKPGALPEIEFNLLIKKFPNYYEIVKYVDARLSSILRNYFDTAIDGEQKYNHYMNKRFSQKGTNLTSVFLDSELEKYKIILRKLEEMLNDENNYNEKQWQKEIIQIILLLCPKYINVFQGVTVRDSYSKKNRELDYLLVDSNGNIDIVEIKKPFENCVVTPGTYRDNHIPYRELSGTVMQIEKYIFYLNKWGKDGEDKLTEKYKAELPNGFKLKITNPNGIIIMGRDNNLTTEQQQDFEVIKRKYKNIVDIITYDDLLRRLQFTVDQLKQKQKTTTN